MNDHPEQVSAKRCLLIVDDQHSVRVSLELLLTDAGYRTICADSCAAALAVAEKESPDGALIDVHMPVKNGIQACRELQAQASAFGRVLRVWLMTGAVSNGVERSSIELGTFGIFRKPFSFAELCTRLDHGFNSPVPALATIAVNAKSFASGASP